MPPARTLPRRDTLAITASLGGVTALCWLYLAAMARGMCAPESMCRAALQIRHWSAGYAWMMASMWIVMMVGMMLPSVLPAVLIYAAVARKAAREGTPVASAHAFVLGYVAVWIGFSLLATAAQWQLDRFALLSPMMVSDSPALGAGLLIAAGAYQLLPIKNQCLKYCRGPIQFIADHWKPGAAGAFRMGLEHGAFCLGCCWMLMLLLFVGGVMNLAWIAAITVFVLLEKAAPFGDAGGRVTGVTMMAAGALALLLGR